MQSLQSVPPPGNEMAQLVCGGCQTVLMYIRGNEMAQLVCGGCQTVLMYIRGATSVQCSCCHTINLAY
ncbi:hypothetical protein Pfo_010909 [Paulownia fortunei]|nr:hypothetical protein Pfo_010909 [Paulownia fortunei]